MLMGKGVVWAEGDEHANMRRILTPAFTYVLSSIFYISFHYSLYYAINSFVTRNMFGTWTFGCRSVSVFVVPCLETYLVSFEPIAGVSLFSLDVSEIRGGLSGFSLAVAPVRCRCLLPSFGDDGVSNCSRIRGYSSLC